MLLNPIIRRRERRILAVLHACAPLTELELCYFTALSTSKIRKPLINLAGTRQVVCTPRKTIFAPDVRTWHLPTQEDADA